MILLTDLDGTLLCDDKTVSEGNRRAVAELLEGGGKLVLATGRAVEGAKRYAKELAPDGRGCYIAAFNGALLYDCAAERVLLRRSVPAELVQEIFDAAEMAGIYAQTFCDGKILATRQAPELDYYRSKNPMEYVIAGQVAEHLRRYPEHGSAAGAQKVVLIALDDHERLVRFQQEHLGWEEAGRCGSVFSCREYLEYCPGGVSKGSAAEYFMRGARGQITVAVGDEENDLSMIRAADVGVAMRNGTAEAKAAADYVTECDNNHDAVAEVIRRYWTMDAERTKPPAE